MHSKLRKKYWQKRKFHTLYETMAIYNPFGNEYFYGSTVFCAWVRSWMHPPRCVWYTQHAVYNQGQIYPRYVYHIPLEFWEKKQHTSFDGCICGCLRTTSSERTKRNKNINLIRIDNIFVYLLMCYLEFNNNIRWRCL